MVTTNWATTETMDALYERFGKPSKKILAKLERGGTDIKAGVKRDEAF